MIFEHSFWWLFPAILISLAVASLKYKKLSRLPDIAKGTAILISVLRFFIIFLLCLLILNPALSLSKRVKEKPVLIIAQDNSESLLKSKDSLYYMHEYKESLERRKRYRNF